MDNKTLAVSIEYLKDEMSRLNRSVEKLSDQQSEMNIVLVKNTAIVEEHERRSTAFEGWAEKANQTLQEVGASVNKIHFENSALAKEIEPIKLHVAKVSKIVNFLDGVPVVLKVTIYVFTILTALYGTFEFVTKVVAVMSGK